MYLHDSIIWAVCAARTAPQRDGFLEVDISCNAPVREEIAAFLQETFGRYWREAQDEVESHYELEDFGENDDDPAEVRIADEGVQLLFSRLVLSYCDGEFSDHEYGNRALEKTLRKLLRVYPEVSYEGYIGYAWSDSHGGDVIQYELSSERPGQDIETDKVYDFVGKSIAAAAEKDDFWDELSGQANYYGEKLFAEVLRCLYLYKEWVPQTVIDRFLNLADEIGDDVRTELEDLLAAWENGKPVGKRKETWDVSDEYKAAFAETVREIDAAYDAQIEKELDMEENRGDGMTAEDIRAILDGTYEKRTAEDGVDRSLLVYAGINVLAMAASAVLEGKLKQVPPTEDERRYPEFIMTVADTGNSYVFVLMKTPAQVTLNIYTEPGPMVPEGLKSTSKMPVQDGRLALNGEMIEKDHNLFYLLGCIGIRHILREKGLLDQVRKETDGKTAVLVTMEGDDFSARIVRGEERILP